MREPDPPAAESLSPLRRYFLKGAGGMLFLQLSSTGLVMVTSLLLARSLGARGLGVYVYAVTWIRLLVLPTLFGLEQLLPREVAVYAAKEDWSRLSGLLRWSVRRVVVSAAILTVAAAVVSGITTGGTLTESLATFWICLPLLVAEATLSIRAATLRGLRHVVRGGLPNLLLKPALFALLLVGVLILPEVVLSPVLAGGLQVATAAVAVVLSEVLFRRTLAPRVRAVEPVFEARLWWGRAVPFLLQGGISAADAHLDLLLVGSLAGKHEAGVYSVVSRAAGLLAIFLFAANGPLAPLVAHLGETAEYERLQRFLTKIARRLFPMAAVAAVLLVLLRNPVLGLFGPEFRAGSTALILLGFGQLVNVAAGSVGLILNMTGHERDVLVTSAVVVPLKLAAGLVLIPALGVTGAAIGATGGLVLWNLVLSRRVFVRLGIHASVLGPSARRRRA